MHPTKFARSASDCLYSAALFLLLLASPVFAAPRFDGAKEAVPAPSAAVLRWDRAAPAPKGGTITYRIYQFDGDWNFSRPVAEVKGNEWVLTRLQPGRDYQFIVRARDATGEDANRRVVRARPSSTQPTEEWRGVWFTRFEWASGSREEISGRVSRAMSSLAAGNFNAVIFQVRGQGDTLYPSAEEPWSELLSGSARGFDPVAFALGEARKNRLQFHAWMNLSVIWQSKNGSLPSDRRHPFYRFANAKNPNARAGLLHDASGKSRQWGADNYVWLTHGNPEVNAYLRRQVASFLLRYKVDGLHLDDRTGNPNGASRDPVSVRRHKGRGNPMKIANFEDWQHDQLSRFLSDVYVQAKAINPNLLVSAAPFGIADRTRIPSYGRFQDARKFGVEPEKWLRLGLIDVLMPQIYWDLPDPDPNYGTVLRDWLSHNRSGRPIWPGSALGKYGEVQPLDPMQERYVALARSLRTGGNTFFSYGAADASKWRDAAQKIYPAKARVPVPTHMRAGNGQIMGTVTDSAGKAAVDCWVSVKGSSYIYLSSGDGFFGIPNLRPGTYAVSFSSGSGAPVTHNAEVTAGHTAIVDVKLSGG